jgi:hypothetical protein
MRTALYSWGELAWGRHLGLCLYVANWGETHNTLVIKVLKLTAFVHVPLGFPVVIEPYSLHDCGLQLIPEHLKLSWGHSVSFLTAWPWSWAFYKHWQCVKYRDLPRNSEVEYWVEVPRNMYGHSFMTTKTFAYGYRLKSGEIQKRIATVGMERREWRMRGLMWLPWPRLVKTTIDVQFNEEVGERTGSWKGGTTGGGYDMLPGETMEQTLYRMERERTFA